jgi:hypothetical protein
LRIVVGYYAGGIRLSKKFTQSQSFFDRTRQTLPFTMAGLFAPLPITALFPLFANVLRHNYPVSA